MKRIKWLLTLAESKPLIFSLALLLIAIAALAAVIVNRDAKIGACDFEKKVLQVRYERRMDSVSAIYSAREAQLNNEVKKTLEGMIDYYQKQLQDQKELNNAISATINKTEKILKKNKNQIENLKR